MPRTDTTPRTNRSFTVGNNSERKTRMGRERVGGSYISSIGQKPPSLSNQVVYSTRCSSDKRCWKLHNPLGERSLSAYVEAHHRSTRYCPETGSANLQTRWGYFNPWQAGRQAGRDKWGWLQSSPALDVAVPALLLVRLGQLVPGADVVRQVGPEPL